MSKLEEVLGSDLVQGHLPNLGSENAHKVLEEYTEHRPLRFPRTEPQVIESLIGIGHCLIKHEKHADIWKPQVRPLEQNKARWPN
jgi:hypothetical protein